MAMRPATDAVARGWASIETNTRKVAGNVKEATAALLRWSGITALVGGGIWGAGTLGMDALGKSVLNDRSAAMGAGTTYGGRQAFNVAFGRFGNPEGVLGKVSELQASANHTALRNLGLSEDEIRNSDPADLAARAYEMLGEKARRTPKHMLGDMMRANRLDEVFDIGQARQAGQASGTGEMGELQGAFKKNRGRFNLSDETTRAWAKFTMNMEIASGVLKKTFAGALAKLTPCLTKLSESFTALIEKLGAENGPLARVLEDLDHWLEEVTKNVTEEQLEQWIRQFMDGVRDLAKGTGDLTKALANLLRWFGITPAHASTGGGDGGGGGGIGSGAMQSHGSPSDQGSTGKGSGAQGGGTAGGQTPAAGHSYQGTGKGGGAATGRGALGGSTGPGSGEGPSGAGGTMSTGDAGPLDLSPVSGDYGVNSRGVQNRNPGNIMAGSWANAHGAVGSAGVDYAPGGGGAHGVAVFPSHEAGFKAMEDLARAKYNAGQRSAYDLISRPGSGWTPGNPQAGANIAKAMGIGPHDDLRLDQAERMAKFKRALAIQELGGGGAKQAFDAVAKNAKTRVTISKQPGNDAASASHAASAQTP